MTLTDYMRRNRLPDGRLPCGWLAHYRMLQQQAKRAEAERR